MKELRQDIFPICSFGRAENLFYQSKDSLCPEDLDYSEVFTLIQGHGAPIFPSHLLDREDWLSLGEEIIATGVKPRVQVALGREWEELSPRILKLHQLGWGIDILIDRPLTMLVTPSELHEIQDWRWIACPLRFFNLKDLLKSLEAYRPQRELLLCFLEPRTGQTLLLNPDELILTKKWLDENPTLSEDVSLLLLKSSLAKDSGFYQDPSLKKYQENFVELGEHRQARRVAKSLKSFSQIFAFFFYMGAVLFSRRFSKMSGIPMWKIRKFGWDVRSKTFDPVYLAINKAFWWLRSQVLTPAYLYVNKSFWKTRARFFDPAYLVVNKAFWRMRARAFDPAYLGMNRLFWIFRNRVFDPIWLKLVAFRWFVQRGLGSLKIGFIKAFWVFHRLYGDLQRVFGETRGMFIRFYWFTHSHTGTLRAGLVQFYWFLHSAFGKARLAVIQAGWFLHSTYGKLRLLFIRGRWFLHSTFGSLRVALIRTQGLLIQIRWSLHSVYGKIRMRLVHVGWFVRSWIPRIFNIIFWPILKIYWFAQYQYDARLRPHVRRVLNR